MRTGPGLVGLGKGVFLAFSRPGRLLACSTGKHGATLSATDLCSDCGNLRGKVLDSRAREFEVLTIVFVNVVL